MDKGEENSKERLSSIGSSIPDEYLLDTSMEIIRITEEFSDSENDQPISFTARRRGLSIGDDFSERESGAATPVESPPDGVFMAPDDGSSMDRPNVPLKPSWLSGRPVARELHKLKLEETAYTPQRATNNDDDDDESMLSDSSSVETENPSPLPSDLSRSWNLSSSGGVKGTPSGSMCRSASFNDASHCSSGIIQVSSKTKPRTLMTIGKQAAVESSPNLRAAMSGGQLAKSLDSGTAKSSKSFKRSVSTDTGLTLSNINAILQLRVSRLEFPHVAVYLEM